MGTLLYCSTSVNHNFFEWELSKSCVVVVLNFIVLHHTVSVQQEGIFLVTREFPLLHKFEAKQPKLTRLTSDCVPVKHRPRDHNSRVQLKSI